MVDWGNHRFQIFSKDESWNKTIGKKDLIIVNLIFHGMLLCVKQVTEYLLVMTTIVFKYSVEMVNSCSNLVQKDQKIDNSDVEIV